MKKHEITSNRTGPALGSLAAVAAWVMSNNATATPQLSTSVVNVSLTNGAQFDINGDGRMDFNIFFNNNQELVLNGMSGSLSAASTSMGRYYPYSKVLSEGSPVDASLTYAQSTDLSYTGNASSPAALGAFSSGVEFYDTGGVLHYSWLTFNFPSNTFPWTGAKAVSAGWETTANTPILVGTVPEPSVSILCSAALVVFLSGRWVGRRLKKV